MGSRSKDKSESKRHHKSRRHHHPKRHYDSKRHHDSKRRHVGKQHEGRKRHEDSNAPHQHSKRRERRGQRREPSTGRRYCFTRQEFCERRRISASMYQKLKRRGFGPREMQIGRKILIDRQAEADWVALMEKGIASRTDTASTQVTNPERQRSAATRYKKARAISRAGSGRAPSGGTGIAIF